MIKQLLTIAVEMVKVVVDQRLAGPLRHNIPSSLEAVTPEWLNEVLTGFPRVNSVSIGPRTDGTTSRCVLEMQTAEGPRTFFVKLASQQFAGRVFSNLEGLGVRESRFYQLFGEELPITLPQLYYTDVDESSGRFIIIIEDLRKPGRQFRTVDQGCTIKEAELIIGELGKMHALFWNDPRFDSELSWLPSYQHQPNLPITAMLFKKSIKTCQEKYPDLMVGEALATANAIADNFLAIYQLFAKGDQTVLHGDGYVANMYFDALENGEATEVGFIDFQMVTRGHGVREVTYLLGVCLDAADCQREIERFIRLYCDLLEQQGVTLDFAQAWWQHRAAAIYLLVGNIINASMGHMLPEPINRLTLERGISNALHCKAKQFIEENC